MSSTPPEEKKAWVAFMAAAMTQHNLVATAADKADLALDEYRTRFPQQKANWQDELTAP